MFSPSPPTPPPPRAHGHYKPPVEHDGSRSPHALSGYCTLHGRRPCAFLLFRSALESFVSAQQWTYERVSAAGGRRDLGASGAVLDPGAEASRGRGSSPVAEAVPSHSGRPPPRDNPLARRLGFCFQAGLGSARKTLDTVPRREPQRGHPVELHGEVAQ